MIDAYIELKMEEVTRFRMTTHPVEFDMYYSLLSNGADKGGSFFASVVQHRTGFDPSCFFRRFDTLRRVIAYTAPSNSNEWPP